MPHTRLRPTYTFDQDRLDQLRAVVPEAFADGKIDWDTLRDLLGDTVEDSTAEHFGLSWPGKREARRLASRPSRGVLVPMPGEGVNEDTTRNIFIEGENLEVLKLLLKSYAGRVKMIYIDPPYNTGNDFIYSDDFAEPLEAYLRRTGQADEEGLLQSNPKSAGRFHSNWLTFMLPRLILAKHFLSEDGVIFVSIDDNEVQNLRAVMNEVFGENCFLAQVVVQSNKRGQTYKQISKTHEYLLVYTNNPETQVNELEKIGDKDDLNFEDDLGRFNTRELRNRNPKFGRFNRPNLYYPIYVNPTIVDQDGFVPVVISETPGYTVEILPRNSEGKDSCWRWKREKVLQNIAATTLTSTVVARKKQDGGYLILEKYRKSTYKAKSIWFENAVITEQGTVELGRLGLATHFPFPKPVHLIKKALMIGTDEEALVMDFFSGSGTTAQAILELNHESGGQRQFILVQLPETTSFPEYPTIADVGRQRIRRISSIIAHEPQVGLGVRLTPEDIGFRSYRLDRSHFKSWTDYAGDDVVALQAQFDAFESPLIDDWKPDDLLVEIMLIEGFPLDSTITRQQQFTANDVRLVESDFHDHRLWVCLDWRIEPATVSALTMADNDVFICLDSAVDDEMKLRLSDRGNLKTI